jgi:hypothetical protein
VQGPARLFLRHPPAPHFELVNLLVYAQEMVASIFLFTKLPVTQCATNTARSGGACLDDILRDPSWQAGP